MLEPFRAFLYRDIYYHSAGQRAAAARPSA